MKHFTWTKPGVAVLLIIIYVCLVEYFTNIVEAAAYWFIALSMILVYKNWTKYL